MSTKSLWWLVNQQEKKAQEKKWSSNIKYTNNRSWKGKFADAYDSEERASPIISEDWIVWRP